MEQTVTVSENEKGRQSAQCTFCQVLFRQTHIATVKAKGQREEKDLLDISS